MYVDIFVQNKNWWDGRGAVSWSTWAGWRSHQLEIEMYSTSLHLDQYFKALHRLMYPNLSDLIPLDVFNCTRLSGFSSIFSTFIFTLHHLSSHYHSVLKYDHLPIQKKTKNIIKSTLDTSNFHPTPWASTQTNFKLTPTQTHAPIGWSTLNHQSISIILRACKEIS